MPAMGLRKFVILSAAVVLLSLLLVHWNGDFDPQPYSYVTAFSQGFVIHIFVDHPAIRLPPPPSLDGPLAVNKRLRNAQLILKGRISGPESLLVEAEDTLYTGTWDGKVLKIVDGRIVDTLRFTNQTECGTFDTEPLCGRPLGIRRLNKRELVVADAYLGVFTADFGSDDSRPAIESTTTQVFSPSSAAERPTAFVNDLDVLDESTIFFTDSSSKWDRRRFVPAFLEQLLNGRVFKLTKESGGGWRSEVLLDKLHFANGLQIHADRQSLLICECSMARIIRFYFNGPKKGRKEVFIENLPGFPIRNKLQDNIRYSPSSGTYFVGLAGVRQANEFSLLDALGDKLWLRKLTRLVPDRFMGTLFNLIKKKHGFVLELDGEGTLISSLQDPGGMAIADVSQATPTHDGTSLYLGSFHADFIAKVPLGRKRS